ncbi:MAG: acyl-ACP--UDP-N-acetylglucosamine O-acyltransferase [Planctomycetes bacterium]|nr:acyl-ACP--UDP-N-acetylglucosamine O-acyltransferase [Planctomycetota bacterium]
MSGSIHATAIVDRKSELGAGVEVGAYCFIGPRVQIGPGTRLLPHVSIMENTSLGSGNLLFPGVVIGGPPQDKKFAGEETWIVIGDRNVFREHVTVNRGTSHGGGTTRIGNECYFMTGSHIAHDCQLGNRITMANNVLLGGHVVVEDGAGFGGLTAAHHFVSIGRYAFVGGMTRIIRDAPPYLTTEGNPARVRAVNRVGLKRNGFSDEVAGWLKLAHRLLFFEGIPRNEARARLAEQGPIPPDGEYLLGFLQRMDSGNQGRARQP